ncbi:hypothetical protein GMORB2_0972 [Geosmithia morbida]|uniref:Uncharacterized protein n=1 Tax=Geosmithia morbida TaxID=1094350 RepID=A0A9P4Z1V0_9HYPO|nr:uncharacterized protein GMORB2_0972 [Geosmithia morbida]KAF4125728.1 hypothetical protein GMORB2_0972 [Geosmithia morbida]
MASDPHLVARLYSDSRAARPTSSHAGGSSKSRIPRPRVLHPTQERHSRGSDDSHPPSKFSQAMKNPNWRQRESTEESGCRAKSPFWIQLHSELTPYWSQAGPEKADASPSHLDHDETLPGDLIDLSPPASQCRGYANVDTSASPLTEDLCEERGHTDEEKSLTYCAVLSHRQVPHNTPLSIIELQPISGHQARSGGREMTVAEIRPAERGSIGTAPYTIRRGFEEHVKQSAADTSTFTGKTPQKASCRPPLVGSEYSRELASLPKLRVEKHRNRGMLENPLNDKSKFPQSDYYPNHLAAKQTSVEPVSSASVPARDSTDDEDALFRKCIRRLQGTAQEKSSQESGSRLDEPARESTSYSEHSIVLNGRQGTHTILNKPEDRLMRTSDSGYTSAPTNHTPTNSKLITETSAGTFNPKAREFLSLSERSSQLSEESHRRFRPVDLKELFSRNAESTKRAPPTMDYVPPCNPIQTIPGGMEQAPTMPPLYIPSPGMDGMYDVNNTIYGTGPLPGGPPQYPLPYQPKTFAGPDGRQDGAELLLLTRRCGPGSLPKAYVAAPYTTKSDDEHDTKANGMPVPSTKAQEIRSIGSAGV